MKKVENSKFYHYQNSIFLKDVDAEKVVVSNKTSFGEKTKYFNVKPLHNAS